ncbi:MAG: hypothetical protein JXB03_06570 [Spirochaetales bacterium]|nr:hypothetical protein [Spirochaetales bacterium]
MELDLKIRGDWYELTEYSKSIFTLQDYFRFPKYFLESCLEELQYSVEGGIIQYKKNILLRICEFIDSLKFDSRGLDFLEREIMVFKSLLYCIQTQYLAVSGIIRPRTKVIEGERKGETGDIKKIIADVNERIGKNPELKVNQYIKNILLQVQIYKKELSEMQRLAPTIPRDKQPGFAQNYKQRFDEIAGKISQNYLLFLDEEDPVKKEVPAGIWQYDLTALKPLYASQARLVSKGVSIFAWAREEGYKTRETLFKVLGFRDEFDTLLAREKEMLKAASPSAEEEQALQDFSREFGRILEKQIASFY